MLVERDLRYYVHVGATHTDWSDYLVLMLEDERFAQFAVDELKKLPAEGLALILGYLKYPYYCDTPVERFLLDAIAGREREILRDASSILKQLESVQMPRLKRYQDRLLLSEVEVFTEAEKEAMLGGRRRASSIRGSQILSIADRVREADLYLKERVSLFRGIVDRAQETKLTK